VAGEESRTVRIREAWLVDQGRAFSLDPVEIGRGDRRKCSGSRNAACQRGKTQQSVFAQKQSDRPIKKLGSE
jgi:hypothetical protein